MMIHPFLINPGMWRIKNDPFFGMINIILFIIRRMDNE